MPPTDPTQRDRVGSRLLAVCLAITAALVLVATAGASRGSRPAGADYVLAEVSLGNAGGSAGIDNMLNVVFCIDNDGMNCSTHVDALTFPAMTAASAGTTIWADTSRGGFDMVVTELTDAAADNLGYQAATPTFLAGPGWFLQPEPSFFAGRTGLGGIDLAGYAIHSIGFRVDSVRIASPGEDPNGDGVWTDFGVTGAFVFKGTVASRVACRDGGWQSLRGPDRPFSNQGECVALVGAAH